MLEIVKETLVDSLKLLPFLFFTFLFIELIEHKFSKKTKRIIEKSNKYGPVIGSVLGIIPQCGFSVMATNLYITRVISLGTLFSIYLSTSDEMLPILISRNTDMKIIILIIFIKVIAGMLFGFLIDSLFRKKGNNNIYELCEDENCHCERGIFKSSVIHTFKILTFILFASFLVNVLFEYTNENFISKLFMKNTIFGPFLGSLVGLIPNCGASVVLTELFINNVISFSTCIAGLLTGSGVAIIVLFRTNKNWKENLSILATLYLIGVLVGIFIDIISVFIL